MFPLTEDLEKVARDDNGLGYLQKHADEGSLKFSASRPTLYGLEMHLVAIHKQIIKFRPEAVILDPITNLITLGSVSEVKSMLIRLIHFLQREQITVIFTALTLNNIEDKKFLTSGLGMGLYISSEIIKSHGGELHVYSEHGKGSTFSIHLPLLHPASD